jgi:Ca2+/H+ antiporter, TMEM165/GDT1 family
MVWICLMMSLVIGLSHGQLVRNENGGGVVDDLEARKKYANEFDRADLNRDHLLQEGEFVQYRLTVDHQQHDFIDFHDKDGDKNIPKRFKTEITNTEQMTLSFWTAFLNSIAMIIVTELGDKTFFIAAILAMRHERGVVFAGAISALALMTVLSSIIGFALPALLPRQYTHFAASVLFVYFGVKLLSEAYEMHRTGSGDGPSDELEEVESELKVDTDIENGDDDKEEHVKRENVDAVKRRKRMMNIVSQSFTLTFLAEWGDRSQIATIALASAKDPIGVTMGGIIGHAMCTGLAVVGGRMLASKISEKTVSCAGGTLFLIFAIHSFFFG